MVFTIKLNGNMTIGCGSSSVQIAKLGILVWDYRLPIAAHMESQTAAVEQFQYPIDMLYNTDRRTLESGISSMLRVFCGRTVA